MKKYILLSIAVCFTLQAACSVLAETKEEVIQAVNQAAQILEQEGEAGLPKVKDIRFGDNNYVFVNDFDGNTLMHIKEHLIGKNLISLKDDTGKRFFADFTSMAQSSEAEKDGFTYCNGEGWVSYRWPKPDQKEFSPKSSYIKGCLMGDKNVYVGAGIYEE